MQTPGRAGCCRHLPGWSAGCSRAVQATAHWSLQYDESSPALRFQCLHRQQRRSVHSGQRARSTGNSACRTVFAGNHAGEDAGGAQLSNRPDSLLTCATLACTVLPSVMENICTLPGALSTARLAAEAAKLLWCLAPTALWKDRPGSAGRSPARRLKEGCWSGLKRTSTRPGTYSACGSAAFLATRAAAAAARVVGAASVMPAGNGQYNVGDQEASE